MRFGTEAAALIALVAAPAWGQAGYPSPSSYPARPTYRTPDTTPSRRRPAPVPAPTSAPTPTYAPTEDPELAGQVDHDAPQATASGNGAGYDAPPADVPASSSRHAPTRQASTDGPPPEVQRSTGPTATSGSARFDDVGRIGGWAGQPVGQSVVMAHPTLPVGSFVEVTALDSGRTIAASVVATGGGSVGDLSPAGLAQLGLAPGDGVRVRTATPPPPDQMALRSGRAAPLRASAPPGLLVALRQQLAARSGRAAPHPAARASARPDHGRVAASTPGATDVPPRQAPTPRQAPVRTPAPRGRWFVQVAALSSADRARALLGQVGGGRVVAGAGVYRVQAGPYADATAAARARDGIARRGYGDARIVAGD